MPLNSQWFPDGSKPSTDRSDYCPEPEVSIPNFDDNLKTQGILRSRAALLDEWHAQKQATLGPKMVLLYPGYGGEEADGAAPKWRAREDSNL
jgi:hypothetical protein